jgi:hypothetical protein
MNVGVAFVVVLYLLTGEPSIEGGVMPSMEACEAQVAKLPAIIASYNESAENPVKITHYAASCAPFKKAPQGKEV